MLLVSLISKVALVLLGSAKVLLVLLSSGQFLSRARVLINVNRSNKLRRRLLGSGLNRHT